MKRILVGTCLMAACTLAVAAGTAQSSMAAPGNAVVGQEPPPAEPPLPEQPPAEPPLPEPPSEPPMPEGEAADMPGMPGEEETITGCLQAGDEEGTFKLTNVALPESDGPQDVPLQAPPGADLSPLTERLGNAVEVAGSWEQGGVAPAAAVGDGQAFIPLSVAVVGETCD